MRLGSSLDLVTGDALILRFGAAMLRRSGPTKSKLIAQRMRQMARLKMEVSKDPTPASLSVLIFLQPSILMTSCAVQKGQRGRPQQVREPGSMFMN